MGGDFEQQRTTARCRRRHLGPRFRADIMYDRVDCERSARLNESAWRACPLGGSCARATSLNRSEIQESTAKMGTIHRIATILRWYTGSWKLSRCRPISLTEIQTEPAVIIPAITHATVCVARQTLRTHTSGMSPGSSIADGAFRLAAQS